MKQWKWWQSALVLALTITLTGCPSDAKKDIDKKAADKKTDKKDPKKQPKKEPKPAKPVKKLTLSELKSPWKNAKVGDWVEFSPHYGMTDVIRHEIKKIGDGKLAFEMTNKTKNKPMSTIEQPLQEFEAGYNDPYKLEPKPEIKEVELTLNGKKLKCIHYKRVMGENTTETWLAPSIALNGGIVKSIRNGSLKLEIKDFHKAK